MTTPGLVLRGVEVEGRALDVRVADERVAAIGPDLAPSPDDVVFDGHGGALLPGLHDHHIHVLATAAAAVSVAVGPSDVRDASGLARALRDADRALAPGRWLRAIGHHESAGGDLDRASLDQLVPHRPARVQHRSGARWTLNSAAIDALALDARSHPGIERDDAGRPTGRLHRGDDWLRDLLPVTEAPDLATLGAELVRAGVTGVTDTTPSCDLDHHRTLADAVTSGALPQRVAVTGGPALAGAAVPAGLERGPVKLVIDDATYPGLDELVAEIGAAHGHSRAVSVHCVTRAALVLALAAWDAAGSRPGDRIEHAAVVPPELLADVRRHGLTVVTQPGFVAARGDDYRRDVDADDLPHLYRCRSLLDAGIPVAGSTDAPYAPADPWAAMQAAVDRTTPSGAVLGAGEAVSPARALALFLGDLSDPGGPARTVHVGVAADLCLLAVPLAVALDQLRRDLVVATIRRGRLLLAIH